MLVTRGGIPLNYELYPGNICAGRSWHQTDVSRVTVVAEATAILMAARAQPALHCGVSRQECDAQAQGADSDADGYEGYRFDQDGEAQCNCKIIARGEERIIATYSKKRARKDRHSRERALEKLLKRLKRSAKPLSLVSKGHARFLNVPSDGEATVNEEKVAQAARWDGIHTIIAWGNDQLSTTSCSPSAVAHERGFRTNKHDLRIRPIFH